MTTDTLTQPIKWHGGKHYLAKRIIELMPKHTHYVEPFFGGGSVLLQKPFEGISEVANDLNGDLWNFWKTLSTDFGLIAMKRQLEATPFSEQAFDLADFETSDPIQRAANFFIRARQSRQGLMKDFATLSRNRTRRGMNEQVSSWLTGIEGLADVHARIKRVVILNDKAENVIKQQDGANTLFYLDPPYVHETRATTSDYRHEMTNEQHVSLVNLILGCEGQFVVSGYDHPIYAHLKVEGWEEHRIEIPNNASSAKEKEIKTECLWIKRNS